MNHPDEDPRLSFDKVPETYDLARPEYPAAAFEGLFGYIRAGGIDGQIHIVEIGPGTGQATRALLEHGARVAAVEIGPNLARFLRHKFTDQSSLRVINAAFEDVELPRESFDLVFAATAFHWLDPDIRITKACELLRRHGVLATLSTIQVRSELDRGYFERTQEVYERWRPGEPVAHAPEPEETAPPEYEEFRASPLLGDAQIMRFRWDQTYSTDAYEALVRSYSNTQTMAPDAREGLIADLRAIIDSEYNGEVVRPLVIALTMARKR